MSYTRWTAEEITKLHLLLEEGKTHDAIARIMRCKPDRITNRICWEKQSAEQRQARQTRVQEWRHRTRKTPRSTAHFAERPGARPPAPLIEDAQRRALAPRSISAFVFGDPAPGYSALDRRTGA